jgi:hypothetical protein
VESKKDPSRLEEEIVFSEESIPKKIVPLVPRIIEVPVQSTVSCIIREFNNPRSV